MSGVSRTEVFEAKGQTTFIDLDDLRTLVEETKHLEGSTRVKIEQAGQRSDEWVGDSIMVTGPSELL